MSWKHMPWEKTSKFSQYQQLHYVKSIEKIFNYLTRLQHKYSIQLKSKAKKNIQIYYVSDWCSGLRRIDKHNINRKQKKKRQQKNHLETSCGKSQK